MKFFHYNIFARSLGSNTIPWVMTISNEWKQRIELLTNQTYREWLNNHFIKEYELHFHKNFESGNKGRMRQLWSQRILQSNDLPLELSGLTFVSENCIKYLKNNQEFHATTLPGILSKSIPEISTQLYDHIMEIENYFTWELRGPRIYHEIMSSDSDIVALSEYDIHDVFATYRNDSTNESFSTAMKETGYSGFLLKALQVIITSDVNGLI